MVLSIEIEVPKTVNEILNCFRFVYNQLKENIHSVYYNVSVPNHRPRRRRLYFIIKFN